MSDDKELLAAEAPPKKISEMTEAELDAFVDKLYARAAERLATAISHNRR